MSKELFKIEITVSEDIMHFEVLSINDYKPSVYEIMGVLEMQKTSYHIQNSTERLEKYMKEVKKVRKQTKQIEL
jgi:hypothetical protein